ncbi:metallophosphoesterase family protein [Marinigracilibium pacificum]|uniref:Phosphoesterase n=1 Tax=Marinigracilibium pacificum TaxID=2729599 RepID=A0A848IZY8_9BACT|nr:metallophosphoesterase family protein [Marinigracilibium pacificum]NMM49166.1 metallophosphoesterase family protein [Marinigracilibium pacificum]
MIRIGLISDTHSHLEESVFKYFGECDEIWHAGDIGDIKVLEKLEAFKPVRAVFGNIDGNDIRIAAPEDQIFEIEGLKVWITHIGGYPPKYTNRIKKKLDEIKPGLFICGHSHILKVMPDRERNLVHMNPGAAGKVGFHKMKTLLRFSINNDKLSDLEVIELGRK